MQLKTLPALQTRKTNECIEFLESFSIFKTKPQACPASKIPEHKSVLKMIHFLILDNVKDYDKSRFRTVLRLSFLILKKSFKCMWIYDRYCDLSGAYHKDC